MNPDDIEAALISTFKTLATGLGWAVAWENMEFDPPRDFWFRPTFLPAEPEAAAIGPIATNIHQGIFQISVFDKKDNGNGVARAKAKMIIDAYPRGAVLTYNTVSVRVEKSYRLDGRVEDKEQYYHIPVRVQWRTEV